LAGRHGGRRRPRPRGAGRAAAVAVLVDAPAGRATTARRRPASPPAPDDRPPLPASPPSPRRGGAARPPPIPARPALHPRTRALHPGDRRVTGRPLVFVSCGATTGPLIPHLARRFGIVVPSATIAAHLERQGIEAIEWAALADRRRLAEVAAEAARLAQ